MNATFYSFSKKRNSTKVPDVSGDTISVLLKDGCSMNHPSLRLHNDHSFPPNWNYCSFMDRFYFIDDIVSIHADLIQVNMSIDPMATYKASIGSETAFILYDTSANTEIVDTRLALEASATVSKTSASFGNVTSSGGTYLLTVTGQTAVDTFALTRSQMDLLLSDISTWTDDIFNADVFDTVDMSLEDIFKNGFKRFCALFKQFSATGSIPENIRSCVHVPWSISADNIKDLYLGNYDTGYNFGVVTGTMLFTAGANIPWQFSDWRRRAPYTQVYVYLPYVGIIQLSADNLSDATYLSATYCIAKRDGTLTVTLQADGDTIGVYSGDSSASVPVGISNVSGNRVAGSVISSIASLGAAVAIKGAAGAIYGATSIANSGIELANSIIPNQTAIGGYGGESASANNFEFEIFTVSHDTNVEPSSISATVGTPTMAQKRISSISGYCQCANASIQIAASSEEIDMINAYLNGGFFYE